MTTPEELHSTPNASANAETVLQLYEPEISALEGFLSHLDMPRADCVRLLVNTANKPNREKRHQTYRALARLLGWQIRTPFPPAVEAVVKYRWPEQDWADYVFFQPRIEDEESWGSQQLREHRRLVQLSMQERNYDLWRAILTPQATSSTLGGFDADAAAAAAPFLANSQAGNVQNRILADDGGDGRAAGIDVDAALEQLVDFNLQNDIGWDEVPDDLSSDNDSLAERAEFEAWQNARSATALQTDDDDLDIDALLHAYHDSSDDDHTTTDSET